MWLLERRFRRALEELVSDYQGRDWRVRSARDLSDLACHPCAVVSDGSGAVFVKYSEAADAGRQFEIERESLRFLSRKTGVLTPKPLGIVPAADGTLFVMEAVQAIERGPRAWREIGRTLARIHRVTSDWYGFPMDTYFGPLVQENAALDDWASFYAERRLRPHLRLAVDAGHMPSSVAAQVASVIDRLPGLCGPEVSPTLVHGDAQQNNFISTADGTYVIDPALYYGHPEIDLASVGYWEPVPDEVFEGYRGERAMAPGFAERRELWRISGYLAAVAVEGTAYLDRLTGALQRYV